MKEENYTIMINWDYDANDYNANKKDVLAEGKYRVRITNATQTVAKNGTEGLEISLEVSGHSNKLRHTPEMMGDYRWLDNYGTFNSWEMRFGGEWLGLTSVYQYGAEASCYVEGGFSWNLCNRLKSGRAFAVSDVENPKMTLTEIGSNWDDAAGASVFAVGPEKTGFKRLDSPKTFLNYPFK